MAGDRDKKGTRQGGGDEERRELREERMRQRREKGSQREPRLGEEIAQAFGKVTNVYMLIC